MRREEIVAEARSWLNTRFHHQARLKGYGCDCVGLIIGVRKALGISDYDTTNYSRIPDGFLLKSLCDANMKKIEFSELRPGDVALFNFGGHPQHLAIIGDYRHGGLSIIHAYSIAHKVVEHRLDQQWIDRIVACYQIEGVA